jgi:hypothetical protein
VGIYTLPPLVSDDGVSHYARDFIRAARHQPQLLRLPRAQAAPARRRREVRRRTLNRLADVLFWQAATHLAGGAYRLTWGNVLAGLRLSPRRIARPHIYGELLRAYGAAGGDVRRVKSHGEGARRGGGGLSVHRHGPGSSYD